MTFIDQLLNLAGLLLWLNWRSIRLLASTQAARPGLFYTLKRAETRPVRAWYSLGGLVLLLALRSLFYWHIGSETNWTLNLDLTVISLPFRSDRYLLMALFSLSSFALFLGTFYAWLLLISVINRQVPDSEYVHRWVRLQLGWLENCPALLRFFLPMAVCGLLWVMVNSTLARLGIVPAPVSSAHLWQQALVMSLSSFLVWEFLLIGLLILHLVTSYVYVGNLAFFNFVGVTSRNLVQPLNWIPLRIGKLDFSPLVGILLIVLVAEFGAERLSDWYQRLPF